MKLWILVLWNSHDSVELTRFLFAVTSHHVESGKLEFQKISCCQWWLLVQICARVFWVWGTWVVRSVFVNMTSAHSDPSYFPTIRLGKAQPQFRPPREQTQYWNSRMGFRCQQPIPFIHLESWQWEVCTSSIAMAPILWDWSDTWGWYLSTSKYSWWRHEDRTTPKRELIPKET